MPDTKATDEAGVPLLGTPGPSHEPPPPFSRTVSPEPYRDDGLADGAGAPDEPPPQYTDLPPPAAPRPNPLAPPPNRAPPRPAKCIGSRDVGSGNDRYMDPLLDRDPAYLAAWMTHLAELPPRLFVRMEGSHEESKTESDGKTKSVSRVVDFDLRIDMTSFLYRDAGARESWRELRTVADHEKARRGTSLLQRGSPRAAAGEQEIGPSQLGLAAWAAKYCDCPAALKTFVLQRRVSGLDRQYIRERLVAAARETGYRGRVTVDFTKEAWRSSVYSANAINEWRLTRWVRVVFYLTLLFLLAWPYLFFSTKRFEVLVADWPFSRPDGRGGVEYVSVSEGVFVNIWEGAVRRAVLGRRRGILDQRDLGEGAAGRGGEDVVQRAVEGMQVVQRHYGWGYDT